ncbi:MAG: L-threonylcarbamoyladenylate synthase, partial [Clostridium sp.]
DIPKVAEKLIDKFWPGPMTIILNKKDIVPDETSAGLSTIGVRMPNSEIALKLIEAAGVPIAAPSANISGRPSPTDMERCVEDLDGKIDYILGGERSNIGVESTIVDCTVNPPMVLRPGGITLEMLRTVDENIVIDEALKKKPSADLKPKAPGMKYRHYAPKAKLKIISGKNEKTVEKMCKMLENYIKNNSKVAIITTDENIDRFKNCEVLSLGRKDNLNEIAKNLFETLRKCDDLGVEYILCQGFEEDGVGLAIMNRLNKAAGYDIIKV